MLSGLASLDWPSDAASWLHDPRQKLPRLHRQHRLLLQSAPRVRPGDEGRITSGLSTDSRSASWPPTFDKMGREAIKRASRHLPGQHLPARRVRCTSCLRRRTLVENAILSGHPSAAIGVTMPSLSSCHCPVFAAPAAAWRASVSPGCVLVNKPRRTASPQCTQEELFSPAKVQKGGCSVPGRPTPVSLSPRRRQVSPHRLLWASHPAHCAPRLRSNAGLTGSHGLQGR